MKICAIVCEYNPFHNGHKYLIEQAKILSGCDAVLCVMSASFTQRGDAAVMNKFTRAKHAVECGADCVIQLPACFSVSPAEIFAQGAIKILSSVPCVKYLAFGCEKADRGKILDVARKLSGESSEFKTALKKELDGGNSYKNAMQVALSFCGADGEFISSPNNVLAAEYAKAIKKSCADIDIIPVERLGAGYGDTEVKDNFSSASAIRANISDIKIKNNLPPQVYEDLNKIPPEKDVRGRFDALIRYSLYETTAERLRKVYGCTEGLENKILGLSNLSTEEIIAKAACKRYTASRIRRILTANLLRLYAEDCEAALSQGFYIKPLAVKKERADEIMSALSLSPMPAVIKKNDLRALDGAARTCFEKDEFADKVRDIIFQENTYNYTVRIV